MNPSTLDSKAHALDLCTHHTPSGQFCIQGCQKNMTTRLGAAQNITLLRHNPTRRHCCKNESLPGLTYILSCSKSHSVRLLYDSEFLEGMFSWWGAHLGLGKARFHQQGQGVSLPIPKPLEGAPCGIFQGPIHSPGTIGMVALQE